MITLLLVGALVAAWMGVWIAALAFGFLLVGMGCFIGAQRSRSEGGDSTGRMIFPMALEMSRVGPSSLPRGCLFFLWPFSALTASFTGAAPYIRAARRGPEGLRWLVGQLNSAGEGDRWLALSTLARVGNAEAVPAVVRSLSDPSPLVREAAAYALTQLGGNELSEAALNDDVDDRVWLHAVASARRKGRSVGVPEWRLARLRNLIAAEDEWSEEAGEAIGSLPALEAADVIRTFIRRPGSQALKAAQALGAQRTPEARALLRELLIDKEIRTVRLALHGLLSLRDASTIPDVEPLQKSSDADIQRLAKLVVSNLRNVAAEDSR